MTEEGIKLAEVQTSIVSWQKPVKKIQLYGRYRQMSRLIKPNLLISGRIEKAPC